jgi:hypothetical protein
LIDNFFLDRNTHKNFSVFHVINGLSDHDGQILRLNNVQVKKQTKHQYICREINEETIAKFQISLQNENWEDVYDYGNVNSKFNILLNIFLLNFENSFPLVHKKKEDIINKWITKGIRISCKRKRTVYSLVKKSSDERLKLYYKRFAIYW